VAAVLRRAALRGADPGPGRRTGLPLHRLLQGLHLVEVEAEADEALDVDTEADLVALRGGPETNEGGPVNLHDWIDELMDVLDVDTEVDEALVLDLARDAAHQVERRAAPVTTYLLGFAAGQQDADPRAIEALAARATALAGEWDRPADAKDPDEVDDEVPDDSRVDHTDDRYEDD
jgi:hypothetical protein